MTRRLCPHVISRQTHIEHPRVIPFPRAVVNLRRVFFELAYLFQRSWISKVWIFQLVPPRVFFLLLLELFFRQIHLQTIALRHGPVQTKLSFPVLLPLTKIAIIQRAHAHSRRRPSTHLAQHHQLRARVSF